MGEQVPQEGGGGADARKELLGLANELRKERLVRLLGFIVGLAIVVIYVALFISMFMKALDVEKLTAAVKAEAQSTQLQDSFKTTLSGIAKDVQPVYLQELKSRNLMEQFAPSVKSELRALAEEVGPFYLEELKNTAGGGEIGPLLLNEAAALVGDVGPAYISELQKKQADFNLPALAASEFGQLATDVIPVYRDLLQQRLAEANLTGQIGDELGQLATDVGEAYRKEFDRIAPELIDAAKEAHANLLEGLQESSQDWLKDTVRESLERNSAYVAEKTDLTPEKVEATLANVVVGVEGALLNVVTKRTDAWEADLAAIQEMLDQVPDSKIKNPDELVNELAGVSLQLVQIHLDENLPDYSQDLEW